MHYTCQWPSLAMGDVTLGWTEDQSEMMTEIIQRKMDEGYTFFVIDDAGREVRLRKIDDLGGRRSITIGDKDAEMLIKQGKIGVVDVSSMVETSDPPAAPARRATTAKEAATSQTVATRRMAGG